MEDYEISDNQTSLIKSRDVRLSDRGEPYDPQTEVEIVKDFIHDTDLELIRKFIQRFISRESRRAYRTTLKEFGLFCEKRHGRRLRFDEVSFEDVTAWRDLLLANGKRENTVCTRLAGLRSLFEFGCALGVFQSTSLISQR